MGLFDGYMYGLNLVYKNVILTMLKTIEISCIFK